MNPIEENEKKARVLDWLQDVLVNWGVSILLLGLLLGVRKLFGFEVTVLSGLALLWARLT